LTSAAAGAKATVIPFVEEASPLGWTTGYGQYGGLNVWGYDEDHLDMRWSSLVNRIYGLNSAIGMCCLKLATGYPEPPPIVKVNGEVQPDHTLQGLLNRPNPLMSHAELMTFSIIYRVVGGNVYLHKVRNSLGGVVELWPYHAGQMWPVPSRYNWIEEYEYDAGKGEKKRVPASEIIHLKWPLPDLRSPWLGLSPLELIAREVMTDTEATRFVKALLKNDARPSGVVTLPPGASMSPSKADQLRDKWEKQHGGENRGGIVILEQGAGYERVSMNPEELAFDALRRVPEARIAGNLGVPPIVAGLSVGLERSTFANYGEARRQMTEETFVPMWRSDAVELTQALSTEYEGDPVVAYDTGRVAALQENENEKWARGAVAFDKGGITLDEYRQVMGFVPFDQVMAGDQRGLLLSHELRPPMSRIVDVTPERQRLMDQGE
jgi:HK97 family phage portal protein